MKGKKHKPKFEFRTPNSTPGKETFSESRRCDTYLVLKASFRDKDSLSNEISGWHMWHAKEENSLYKKVSTCQLALEERNRKGHSNILPRLRSPSTNFGNVTMSLLHSVLH